MKRYRFLVILSALTTLAAFALACAGAPSAKGSPTPTMAPSPPSAPAAPVKVQKERQVTIKVPVLTKETSLYPDGLVDQVTTYKYDAGLKLVLEKATFDGTRPDPVERMVADAGSGRTVSESTFDAEGKLRIKRDYSYTDKGLVGTEKFSDGKGQPQSASTYLYDAAGNKTEWKVYDGKGGLKATTKYTYANARLVLIEMSDAVGAKTGSIVLEYDAAGLLAKKTYKAADGQAQKFEVYLWTDGRLTSLENRRADGSLSLKTTYTYGDLGQVLSSVSADASGAVKDRRTFEYAVREDTKTETYWE